MADLIYVGPPTGYLPKFVAVADCGPALDGSTERPSEYYRVVGVSGVGPFRYRCIVANYQVVPVAEFDAWREQQSIERMAAAAAKIQEDLRVEVRLCGDLEIVLKPREGSTDV